MFRQFKAIEEAWKNIFFNNIEDVFKAVDWTALKKNMSNTFKL